MGRTLPVPEAEKGQEVEERPGAGRETVRKSRIEGACSGRQSSMARPGHGRDYKT